MNTDTKQTRLMEFVRELKEAGFKVYAPEKMTTYCHFVKDDKIGYVENGDWGFNFSTVHKPCHECGTGFSMYRDVIPNVKMAVDCFITAPSWAFNEAIQAVRKYKNWADFEAKNNWCVYKEI